jgi:hypothetical protein
MPRNENPPPPAFFTGGREPGRSPFVLKRFQINYLCIYDLYSPVHNLLDACITAYPLLNFFGPQMALAYRLDAISQGPKNS